MEKLLYEKIDHILKLFYDEYGEENLSFGVLKHVSDIRRKSYLQIFTFFQLFDIDYITVLEGQESDTVVFLDRYMNKVCEYDNAE